MNDGSRTGVGLRRRPVTAALLWLAALLALLALAPVASASPQEPVMTLDRLEQLLASSPDGTVPGYFLTATHGATIEKVPVTVLGLVPQAAFDNGDLLLFQAGGPVIDRAGGIAAGMSGSPIYVDDAGDKLVGAVSYGDYFTSNGLGLATPIEHMMTLEGDLDALDPISLAMGRTTRLHEPVRVDGDTVDTVVLAATTRKARVAAADAAAGGAKATAVFRPLSVVQMGGVPPTARAVVEAKKALAARGMELRTGVAGGAAGFDPGFSTALVPGSSVGELFMLGDFWYGGVGTTTYTTADGVLAAFGHPAMWDAGLSAFMTNADVVALWNSAESPYKVVAPGAVRGTIALDSGPGIAGRIGDAPEDVPMTVAVTDELTGRTTSTTSHATQWAIDQHKWPYPYLNSLALLPAFWQATGDSQYDGQITYDLTIGLSDGVDDFTYHRTNIWQDDYGWDAPSMLWVETLKLLGELTFDQDGTVNAHITSIDIAATVSPELTSTRVADVDVAGGIKTGINQVDVTLYAHGSTTPTTVTVPLTIPDGMSRKGTLYAKAPFHAVESMGDGWYGYWGASTGDSSYPPATLTDVVDQLNDAPANDELIVAYAPPESYNEDWIGEPWGDDAVVTGVDLDVYVRGAVQKSVAGISLYPMTWNPVAGRPFALEGSLEIENAAGKKVKIYSREVGETTDTLVTEVTVGADSGQGSGDDESGGSFVALIPKLRHTCTITAVYEGDDDYLYSSESIDVEVRARARLGATLVKPGVVRITASVSPSQTDATIDPRFVIERRVNGTWKKFRVLVATHPAGAPSPSSITTLLELKPGTYVLRNRFMGTDLNTAAVSKPVTVVVN